MLASAGDDGNVLLWVPSELSMTPLGEDHTDDKETWRVKHMCRSSGAEIYDLAWSPDGVFIITGSMDNVTRIYNAQTGWSSFRHLDVKNDLLTVTRPNGTTDRRTFTLRPRCSLGSAQRVCCDTIFRPIRTHLQSKNQRRTVLFDYAR
jgi:WD40 repeat protein